MERSVQTSSETSLNNSQQPTQTLSERNIEYFNNKYDFMAKKLHDHITMEEFETRYEPKEVGAGALVFSLNSPPYDWRLLKRDVEELKEIEERYNNVIKAIFVTLKTFYIDDNLGFIYANAIKLESLFNRFKPEDFETNITYQKINDLQKILVPILRCYNVVKEVCQDTQTDRYMTYLNKLSITLGTTVKYSTKAKYVKKFFCDDFRYDYSHTRGYISKVTSLIGERVIPEDIFQKIDKIYHFIEWISNSSHIEREYLKRYVLGMLDYYEKKNEEALKQLSSDFIIKNDNEDFENEWNQMALNTVQTSIQNVISGCEQYFIKEKYKPIATAQKIYNKYRYICGDYEREIDANPFNETYFENCDNINDMFHNIVNEMEAALKNFFN